MACGKYFRAYLVGSFSALGGFLFGYHTGVISGVLTMKDFLQMIMLEDGSDSAADIFNFQIGLIVGILLFGCILGSLIGGQTSDRFSRKYSISFFSFIFTISAGMQIIRGGLPLLVIARFFAGISIGALSMIVPMYHSEIAATNVRGRIITFQQWAITFGIGVSFWINYGTSSSPSMKDNNVEWQLPLGLQMVPSLILAVGILFCPFSPRWLISHDREDEARDVLLKIRSASHDEIEEEMDRIKADVAYLRENEIESYRQLFRFPLLRPFLLGIGIQILQQLTGINATIYYAPKIFQIFANASEEGSIAYKVLKNPLSTTGFYGIVNFVFTIPAVIFIDKLGRRFLLITGAVIMSTSMLIASILVATYIERHCNNTSDNCTYTIHQPSPYSYVPIIFFIYTFVAGFAFSWGPVPWIYCTEIFPLTMRAKASSLTTAANWATNCLISFLVPTLLYHMYYGTFIMFGIFCAIMIVIVYSLYPETKNRHLEENTTVENSRVRGVSRAAEPPLPSTNRENFEPPPPFGKNF